MQSPKMSATKKQKNPKQTLEQHGSRSNLSKSPAASTGLSQYLYDPMKTVVRLLTEPS